MNLVDFSNEGILKFIVTQQKSYNPSRSSFDYKCFYFTIHSLRSYGFSENISSAIEFDICVFDKHNVGMQDLIDVKNDFRFKEASWKDLFISGRERYTACVNIETLCDIIRFCARLSNMKTFW